MKNVFCITIMLIVFSFAIHTVVHAMSDVQEYNAGLYAGQAQLGE